MFAILGILILALLAAWLFGAVAFAAVVFLVGGPPASVEDVLNIAFSALAWPLMVGAMIAGRWYR